MKKCIRCGIEMEKNLNKDEADELMTSWGFNPFEHTDWDCPKCGNHITEM